MAIKVPEDIKKQEAENLKQLLEAAGITNFAAFCREKEIRGNKSMLSQHLSASRPISLASGRDYAKAFGCSLEDISPRLAKETELAMAHMESPANVPKDRSQINYELIRDAVSGVLHAFGVDLEDLAINEALARKRITSKLLLSPGMQNESAKAELPPQDKEPLKILGELGSTESQTEENGPHQRAEGEAQ